MATPHHNNFYGILGISWTLGLTHDETFSTQPFYPIPRPISGAQSVVPSLRRSKPWRRTSQSCREIWNGCSWAVVLWTSLRRSWTICLAVWPRALCPSTEIGCSHRCHSRRAQCSSVPFCGLYGLDGCPVWWVTMTLIYSWCLVYCAVTWAHGRFVGNVGCSVCCCRRVQILS